MQFLGSIGLLLWLYFDPSASGLASEPETQSKTGEMVVNVFETHSKYFNGQLQNFDCIPLIALSIPFKKYRLSEPKVPKIMKLPDFWTKNSGE